MKFARLEMTQAEHTLKSRAICDRCGGSRKQSPHGGLPRCHLWVSKRGTQSQSMVPSGATNAPV